MNAKQKQSSVDQQKMSMSSQKSSIFLRPQRSVQVDAGYVDFVKSKIDANAYESLTQEQIQVEPSKDRCERIRGRRMT